MTAVAEEEEVSLVENRRQMDEEEARARLRAQHVGFVFQSSYYCLFHA